MRPPVQHLGSDFPVGIEGMVYAFEAAMKTFFHQLIVLCTRLIVAAVSPDPGLNIPVVALAHTGHENLDDN